MGRENITGKWDKLCVFSTHIDASIMTKSTKEPGDVLAWCCAMWPDDSGTLDTNHPTVQDPPLAVYVRHHSTICLLPRAWLHRLAMVMMLRALWAA